jgi:hypothetical protein
LGNDRFVANVGSSGGSTRGGGSKTGKGGSSKRSAGAAGSGSGSGSGSGGSDGSSSGSSATVPTGNSREFIVEAGTTIAPIGVRIQAGDGKFISGIEAVSVLCPP